MEFLKILYTIGFIGGGCYVTYQVVSKDIVILTKSLFEKQIWNSFTKRQKELLIWINILCGYLSWAMLWPIQLVFAILTDDND